MASSAPVRLTTRFLEKVWGTENLSPWYPKSSQKIGEVWFEADLPLLIKFLFTSERLSVQVHPDDTYAAQHENSRGKTEMWYILRAEPGAQIAIGFREKISPARLKEAALSGEIEKLLNWVDVEAGDVFYIPAGTVHAIGAGLAICEIQQHSDVTYRLYDYGRPRELHIDKSLAVASLDATKPKSTMLPVESPYFHTELARLAIPIRYTPAPDRFHVLIFLSGRGSIAGLPFQEGEAWLVPAGAPIFTIDPIDPVKMLRTWVPAGA